MDSKYHGGRGRGRNSQRGGGNGGRGGRGRFALRGFARNLRQAEGFQTVTDTSARPPTGVGSPDDFKEDLAKKCTLKFSGTLKDHEVDQWYRQYRKVWPSPQGGFKGANVTIFWDIENCRPDPDYAPLPVNYAEMLRDAFKATTDARSMRCIASLSKSYPATKPGVERRPGDAKLGYDQLTALNGQAGYMFVMTAPGKWNERVHKDVREVDDQLKCKMNTFLGECGEGDVAVVIAGDQGYAPFCLAAKEKGVNVIVIGPSLAGTSGVLLVAADHFMEWPAFAAFHGREQRKVPALMSPKVHEATERIRRSHVEQYSCVRELDLMILLDTTHSMGKYIEGVRDNIGRVLDQISIRFPWAKEHMRVGCVGYRDFMASYNSPKREPNQFQICSFSSADRVRAFLEKEVEALRGADPAEDVIGGLQTVAEMLERAKASNASGSPRSCVLFHICDMPQHGREFNDLGPDNDSYLDGPDKPTGNALPPPGRTRPWMEEAREVLLKLKNELNVSKYALLQIQPRYTSKMAAAFRRIVGDPEDTADGWSWKKAAEAAREAGGQQQGGQQAAAEDDVTAEPWISTLEMPGFKSQDKGGEKGGDKDKIGADEEASAISSNLVRMMVSTTLVTITRLSQLIYDSKRGLARLKNRTKGQSVALATLLEMDEMGEELGEVAGSAVDAINSGALEMAGVEDDDSDSSSIGGNGAGSTNGGSAGDAKVGGPVPPASLAPPGSRPVPPSSPAPLNARPAGAASPAPVVFDNSTAYSKGQLEGRRKHLIARFKPKLGAKPVDAEEVMLEEPADLDELVFNILDGERYQRLGKELPQLLQVRASALPIQYYRSPSVWREGAQRLVYEAVRLRREPNQPTKTTQELVVMKEFKQSFAHGNSKFRYIQMCQGNVVASFLAQHFNAACAERGIAEVDGRPRPELVYMPMWTASWSVADLKAPNGVVRCNHHVEPYILGKYIKYNSNAGAVNMATLNDICHTFSHWTYEATGGIAMVTDVQGVKDHTTRKVLLTDPAIHCVPLVEGYFDAESNRGPFGVKEFFLSHVCNDACRKLGLRSAEEELEKLRADALAGRLPGRQGTVLDLDSMQG